MRLEEKEREGKEKSDLTDFLVIDVCLAHLAFLANVGSHNLEEGLYLNPVKYCIRRLDRGTKKLRLV